MNKKMKLENIKMKSEEGITKVIDGAGIIPRGSYLMTQEEVKDMIRKRNSIEYHLTKKVRDIIEKIKYQ